MTTTLFCLALAVTVLPAPGARRRLQEAAGGTATPDDVPTRVRTWLSRRGVAPFDLAFLAGAPFVVVGAVAPAVATVIMVAVARRRHRRRRAAELRNRERRAVLAGLDVVIGELRVGSHPAVACESAAAECDGAAADAFRLAAARARLGGSSSGGFRATDSVVAADLQQIANAWAVAETHGLALADLLQAARADLQGRSRFRARVEAGTAGARATAAVLAGLPALGIGLGQLMDAEPVRVLFGDGLGGVLLVIGVALVAAGLVWTDRIVDGVAS